MLYAVFSRSWLGKKIKKEARIEVAHEIDELLSWLYGDQQIKENNPDIYSMFKALSGSLIFEYQIKPHNIREHVKDRMKARILRKNSV